MAFFIGALRSRSRRFIWPGLVSVLGFKAGGESLILGRICGSSINLRIDLNLGDLYPAS